MTLTAPTEQHYLQLKNWFSNHQAIYTWGGPNMAYPMSDDNFLKCLTAEHFNSFCLLNDEQQLVAFGQYYRRLEHHHLGRLAVNPKYRGQGLAKTLIKLLLEQAYLTQTAKGASLFVFKDNIVAYQCYQSLGFIETDYPEQPFPGNMQNCAYMVLPTKN
ncbi:GNAT family N-acetyltransferase [uncultured Paraglaciecola sp.]|uniref:GNAT family N-acetyltransferase n=1 Tax=uncultured Paraglaciecola sp. TaxID=1765024 RepID=UPI0030D88E54|tara:strand:+ start:284156 stop:284632 length:477 start_codon:yes stop_codon:yes gene_type:complete